MRGKLNDFKIKMTGNLEFEFTNRSMTYFLEQVKQPMTGNLESYIS